jgi:hypothetical protein
MIKAIVVVVAAIAQTNPCLKSAAVQVLFPTAEQHLRSLSNTIVVVLFLYLLSRPCCMFALSEDLAIICLPNKRMPIVYCF